MDWRWSFWWLVLPGIALAWILWKHLPEPARGGQSEIGFHDTHIRSAEDVGGGSGQPPEKDSSVYQKSLGQRAAQESGAHADEDLVLPTDPTRMSVWHAVHYVLRIRTNVVLIIASAFGYSFFESVRTLGLLFMRSRFGLQQSMATLVLLVPGIGALVGVLVSGRISDWLARKGKLNARIVVPACAFIICVAAFAPGLYSGSLYIAIALFTVGGAALAATNPPMDAARLDIMHSRLWGRAEGVRTVLRSVLEGAAPLAVGFLADFFGGGSYSGGTQGGAPRQNAGLEYALLIALLPVLVAGVVLLLALRSYPNDAATAAESEVATRRFEPGR